MYNVTGDYNPYTASRYVEIETQLRIIDEQAADNATCSATDPHSCSSVATLASDCLTSMGGRYFTLEPDYLACDSTAFDIMSDNYHAGYWGNEVGAQEEISFTFSAPVTSMGLSLWFDEDAWEWPFSVVVQFHKPASTLAAGDAAEDTPDDPPIDINPERGFSILLFTDAIPVTYSGITLKILPNPNRRVRLAGVAFGILQDYRNSNIKSWDWNDEADIYADSIPATVQKVEVLANNGQFSLTDPDLIECIHPGLRMQTSVIVNGYKIPMKDTILQSITDNGGGIATIESVDNIYLLDDIGFKAKSNSSLTMWRGAANFINAVLAKTKGVYGATESGLPYNLPTQLQSINFEPHFENNTVRHWLPMIAQALKCHIMQDRDGVIRFVLSNSADAESPTYCDTITKANAKEITREIVQRSNIVEIATALVDEDGESLSMFAEITNLYSGETFNKETYSNTLLKSNHGTGVATWLLNQHSRRIKYKAEWRGNPALDLLDCVSIDGKPAIITGLHYSFNGVFSGTLEAYCGLYDILQKTETRAWRETEWNP